MIESLKKQDRRSADPMIRKIALASSLWAASRNLMLRAATRRHLERQSRNLFNKTLTR